MEQNQFLLNKINQKTQKSRQQYIEELVAQKQKIENEQQIKDFNCQKRQLFQKRFSPWVMEAIKTGIPWDT